MLIKFCVCSRRPDVFSGFFSTEKDPLKNVEAVGVKILAFPSTKHELLSDK